MTDPVSPAILSFGRLLVPAFLTGIYALLLFFAVEKIPVRRLRILIPVVSGIVFSLGNFFYVNFLETTFGGQHIPGPGFAVFILSGFFVITLLIMGTITAFGLLSPYLKVRRPWLAFLACFGISVSYLFLTLFAKAFGNFPQAAVGGTVPLWMNDAVLQVFRFSEMILLGFVIFGAYLFIRELIPALTKVGDSVFAYIGLVLVACFLPLPVLAGCCAFSLALIFREIPDRWLRRPAPIWASLALCLAGSLYSLVTGSISALDEVMFSFAILALAVVTPLFLSEPYFDTGSSRGTRIVANAVITGVISGYFFSLVPLGEPYPGVSFFLVRYGVTVFFAALGYCVILLAEREILKRKPGFGRCSGHE
ncbi:MAG: hypothetical protein ABFC24_04155 [Methanoregulaceae archaeon]